MGERTHDLVGFADLSFGFLLCDAEVYVVVALFWGSWCHCGVLVVGLKMMG